MNLEYQPYYDPRYDALCRSRARDYFHAATEPLFRRIAEQYELYSSIRLRLSPDGTVTDLSCHHLPPESAAYVVKLREMIDWHSEKAASIARGEHDGIIPVRPEAA